MDNFSQYKVVIENPKGSYKSFETEGDPVWDKYPLKGVTYPVDYGYIEGYIGEDQADLDVFVGKGNLFGYIKVWRMDVPSETKFFAQLTEEELIAVTEVFTPVLLSKTILSEQELVVEIEKFKSQ
jgi:hypothetical protein